MTITRPPVVASDRPMRLWWIPSCGLAHARPDWQLLAVIFVLVLIVLTRRARSHAPATVIEGCR